VGIIIFQFPDSANPAEAFLAQYSPPFFVNNSEIMFPYLCGMAYIPFDARIAGSWSTPYGGGLGFWPREPV
jgi:hypothetical protein